MDIFGYLHNLLIGNGSVITSENTLAMNQLALDLYNKSELNELEVKQLQAIIMSCNILYNRTDMPVLPIEDGFYDLLLEKYKQYDSNFQVGSAVVDFKDTIEKDLGSVAKKVECPISFDKPIERDEIHTEIYNQIIRKDQPILNKYDFSINPIEFDQGLISKRTHNTEHNHPDLIGSLDKAKFVLMKDAVEAGAEKDPNVVILERDFFMKHIRSGLYGANDIINIVAELKYDGISVEADCALEVESARTRGDTGIGEAADLTPIFKGYTFKHAGCMIGEKPIGVKFEAIMTKSNLYKFNILRNKNYANCRSAIVGLFGASDAYMFRDLITLVPLAIDRNDVPAISNRMEEIEFINRVFRSHGEPLRYCYLSGTVSELLYMIKVFWDEAKIARDHLDFMYDGIVISYLDEDIRQKLGRENYINKYSMAVKFDPIQKLTIFRGYTYEVGQHGAITPMIHYDPVEFIGTIHTKSSGSSFERFKNLGLKYGDYIQVTYRHDVMPYVSKVDCEYNRNNPNPVIEFIDTCPICGSKLMISDSEKMMNCYNMECPGRSIQRMSNMFAKLNIKGFADATFSALGKDHFYQLFDLDQEWLIEKLGNADGIKFKQTMNMLKSEPIYDYIVMGALGFTSMAHKKWKVVLQQITINDLYNLYTGSRSESEFIYKMNQILKGVGEVTIYTIAKEFPFFEQDIVAIMNYMRNSLICSFGKSSDGKLQIRFTGCRNKQLSELLCNAGYDADDSSSAGKKTNILLVPYEGFTSSKVNKVSPDCKIIPIGEFINNMELYLDDSALALSLKDNL